MTTKNAKTVLFASLIAAMILPFSAMDIAVAEVDDDYKKAKDKIKQLKSKANKENADC